MNIIYTVCNRNTLLHALALADSVRQYNPDYTFYLGWADTLKLQALPPHIKLISVGDLQIPAWKTMCEQYFDFEIPAATRPWFACTLLQLHDDCASLVFLAPTVILVRSIAPAIIPNADVILTLNISKPLPTSSVLDDKRILNIGMFHAGSWIMKKNKQTIDVLHWWANRTMDRGRFDLCNGLNMDQLWLNFVPVWIPETHQNAHPGWHYGLNAILNKNLDFRDGSFFVEGQPLISLDFAGIGNFDPVWSDHVALLSESKLFSKLYTAYYASLAKFHQFAPKAGEPGYGRKAPISNSRLLRKNIVRKFKAINHFIDQF